MLDRESARIGRFAWVMAWVGLVVGQLHALSRFATADGKEDLEYPLTAAWAEPAADALKPLLDWGDPDLVYVTYGKIWFPVFAAFTLCAIVIYRRRQPMGFEKWAWRAALAAYVVATLGVFLDYWTQWTGNYEGDGIEGWFFSVAWIVTVPGLLFTLLCSTVLGGTLLVKRFRPRLPAVLLLLIIPLALLIVQATSLGSAALPVMFAFGILGRRLARAEELMPSRQSVMA
ncbi:MAG: hypothetical protein JWR85_2006 [Marmoricola sp.]|nr:hypothetical protein [Marmoricola sp.]